MSHRTEPETPGLTGTRIALVTGCIGAGKSTAVERTVALARAQGLHPTGIWCPARLTGGRKTGISAVDLLSGETRLLAVTREPASADLPGKGPQGQQGCRYRFDPEVLAWASGVLDHAAGLTDSLLVVDEIGPLELKQDQGFAGILAPLSQGKVARALVVVRHQCLQNLLTRLGSVTTAVFTVTAHSRNQIPLDLVSWLARR